MRHGRIAEQVCNGGPWERTVMRASWSATAALDGWTKVEVGIIGINPGVQAGRGFPPVPGAFDYDLWLGPAPEAPFCPQRVARGNEVCYWYYISDYTAGFISGNGVHFVDIAQWGIGDEVMPIEVHTVSAHVPTDGLIDDAIAWRMEVVYENGVRMSYSSEGNPHPDGIRFVGTEGWIHVTGGGTLSADPVDVLKSVIGPTELHLYAGPEHHRNFLDCIRTRRPAAACAEWGITPPRPAIWPRFPPASARG
jgi:hypothetical protein